MEEFTFTAEEFILTAMSIEQKMREKNSSIFKNKEKSLISTSIIAFYILQTQYDDKIVRELMDKIHAWVGRPPFSTN